MLEIQKVIKKTLKCKNHLFKDGFLIIKGKTIRFNVYFEVFIALQD